MNTEHVERLIAALKDANDAISQYGKYKEAVVEELKKHLSIKDSDELLEELIANNAGSKTFRPYKGIIAKFSVEVKYDQAKIAAVLADSPELTGLLTKNVIVPTSAKAVFTFMKSSNKLAEKLSEATITTCRGPYLYIDEDKK